MFEQGNQLSKGVSRKPKGESTAMSEAAKERQRVETSVLMSQPWRYLPHTTAMHLSGGKWLPFPYLVFLSHLIASVVAKGGGRMIVELPPRHGKSEFISKWVPTWFIGNWPDQKVILTTYEANFAASWGRIVRNNLVEFGSEFGVEVATDSAAAAYWLTKHGGGMITAGVGGPITGKGGNLCFPAGTYVDTDTGRWKIEMLFGMEGRARVWGYDHAKKKRVLTDLVAWKETESDKPVVLIWTRTSYMLYATIDHPVYVLPHRHAPISDGRYVKAGDIRPGDIVVSRTMQRNRVTLVHETPIQKQFLFDIQTGTGNFFANGILVHNCIIDDPHKNWKEAMSIATCKSIHDWYDSTFYTRLEPAGTLIVLHTRWTENDLIGYLLHEHPEENWIVVRFPAIAEEDDILGRRPGKALCPERYNEQALARIQKVLGTQKWAGLYQQRPAALEGDIWKRERWKYYKLPPACSFVIQSWDTGFKKNDNARTAYSVCQTWGVFPNGYALLGQYRERVEYPELERMAKLRYAAERPHAVLIEDKASGQSLIQSLQRNAAHIPVIPVEPQDDGSKVMRALAVTPMHEAGNLWIPDPDFEDNGWVAEFLDHFTVFPNGLYKDEIDAASQALSYLRDYSAVGEVRSAMPRRSAPLLDGFRQLIGTTRIRG